MHLSLMRLSDINPANMHHPLTHETNDHIAKSL